MFCLSVNEYACFHTFNCMKLVIAVVTYKCSAHT